MHKRILSILMGVILISGSLAVMAPVANAAKGNPPAMFLPDMDDTAVSNSHILSDRFDGSDTAAHLTMVATSDTTRGDFYVCDPAIGPTIEQGELGSCTLIGSDDTPVSPQVATTLNPADEAYETFWDIPNTLDLQTRHIVGLACIGTGSNIPPTANPNCRTTVEENIRLEDAAGGAGSQTTAGEITSYCTADTASTGGPTASPAAGGVNDPCQVGATTPNTTARTTVNNRFKPFKHGDAVPNDGFVIRALTSPDVPGVPNTGNGQAAAGALRAAIDFDADANADPDTADVDNQCLVIEATATFKAWECAFSTGNITGFGNNELGLWIYESGTAPAFAGGAAEGQCVGSVGGPGTLGTDANCTLDSHYSATATRRATTVKQSFIPGGNHAHQPPDPPANAGCDAGETQVKSHTNNTLTNTEQIELCMADQFTDPFAGGAYTEEVTSPGHIQTCSSGNQLHDHDGNGSMEHCHGVTDGAGHATSVVQDFNNTTGTVTLTSCFETEPQTGASAPANHGCANEAAGLKDTLTLTYGTEPANVKAAFTPNSATDPCNGPTFQQGTVGEHEEFVVCTVDAAGNLVSTGSQFFLQYSITGAHGDDRVAVRFNPAPPPDGTGADGRVTVGIDDVGEGDNFICMQIKRRSNGTDVGPAFCLEKQVLPGEVPPRDVPTNLTAKKSPKFIRGKAVTEDECQPGRQVTLFRRRRGPDSVLGVDTTNSLGRWGVRTGKRRGTYYARIAASSATDAQTGGQLNCLPDQSRDVRRR